MVNPYRLHSSHFEREAEDNKIAPMKVYVLSVEGDRTEKEYFEGVSRNRSALGINMRVDVEVLRRNDTNSAPQYVLELLEEYLRLRKTNSGDMMADIPQELFDSYGEEFIRTYLDTPNKLSSEQRKTFAAELESVGYDLRYRRYLQRYDSEYDEFGILIDRDKGVHSKEEMMKCIQRCKANNYKCYISNPCFEFWLLLHLVDVKEEYKDWMSEIKENGRISHQHTFVSREVSEKVRYRHGKKGIKFEKNYLKHVDKAAERAAAFPTEPEQLVDEVGCNICELIKRLKETMIK